MESPIPRLSMRSGLVRSPSCPHPGTVGSGTGAASRSRGRFCCAFAFLVPCAVARGDLAIDLGTANTLVYAKGRGIVLNEPTVVAYNTRTRQVLAMGQEAWQMIGRTPGNILQRCGVTKFNRPRVLVCVPSALTAVERRAVKEAARRAGAGAVYLMEQPMAAAIGAGLAVHEPQGSMVVDIGGGTAEMAVFSLGGVVALRAIRCGGFDFDGAIQAYVRSRYALAIGERTAEWVKLAIGSAYPYTGEREAPVRGRDVSTGLPRTIVLTPEEVRAAVEDAVQQILSTAVTCLAEAPPELAQDIMFDGIHLVGGGSLLRGVTQRLANATAVPVHLVDLPLECVVMGAGRCLESLDQLRPVFAQADR